MSSGRSSGEFGVLRSRRWLAPLAIGGLALLTWLVIATDVAQVRRERALRNAESLVRTRPVAGRLTGAGHAPYTLRGKGSRDDRLFAAAADVLAHGGSPRARSRALLLTGRVSDAVDLLERASGPGDPELLSDLAAARIAESDELDSVRSAVDAAVAARRALAADARLAAAHFNLGLALERIGLIAEARRSFEEAAALEPGPWAGEARARADALPRPRGREAWIAADQRLRRTTGAGETADIVAADLQNARRWAEGPYLVEWAQARVDGDRAAAGAALSLARRVADALRVLVSETLAADAVTAIERAEAAGERASLELAGALLRYRDGRVARARHEDRKAFELLADAAVVFELYGSPLRLLALDQMSGAEFELGRIEAALARLDEVEKADPAGRGYRGLAAQVAWDRANCLIVRGDYGAVLEAADRGVRHAAAIRDHEVSSAVDALAAQALELLGEEREAWSRRARALRAGVAAGVDQRRAVILNGAAASQIAGRNFAAAGLLLDYAIPLAESARDPLVSALAFAQRSAARDELGHADEAARDRRAAAQAAGRLADEGVRTRLLAHLHVAEGLALRGRDPDAAARHFTRFIEQERRSGQSWLLPRLLYERARVRRAAGDAAGEHADLSQGLDVIAQWESEAESLEDRAALALWGDALRRDLIALELERGDVAAAMACAEARPAPGRPGTLSSFRERDVLQRVQHSLAADAAVVEFVRTGERMIAFTVRSDMAVATALPAAASRIAAAGDALRTADGAVFRDAAAELDRLLLAPIRRHLQGSRTIAFVPDHDLAGLPLGALFDASRRRFLGQEAVVVHTPTALLAVEAARAGLSPGPERAVVVGASEFDRSGLHEARPLPNAEREAAAVAALWPASAIMTGAAATPAALRERLANASLLHYAGHIVGRGPESRMLLSGGTLTARDIARLRLGATRVVVLAACRGSAAGDARALYADMSRAFLGAGVPVVVASATDVDDAKVPATMELLHRFLSEGDDAALALQRTVDVELAAGEPVPQSLRFMAVGGTRLLLR